jgi:hypothetical protein
MSNLFKIDYKLIIILILLAILYFQNCKGSEEENVITIDGKKFGLLKYTLDTVEVTNTTVKNVKGDDIYHETFEIDTAFLPPVVDTQQILKDFFAKNVYKDTLILNDSLGYVFIIDTITKNKLLERSWTAKVKSREIKKEIIVKELPKNEFYLGINGNLDKVDYLNSVGTGLIIKNKKDNIIQLNIGLSNKQLNNSSSNFTPYFGGGYYWKLK